MPVAGADARAAVRAELGVTHRPLILTVARLAEQKGLSTLLDAAALWATREPQPLVAIAGDGPLDAALRDRVEREQLPVRLLGRHAERVGGPAAHPARDPTGRPAPGGHTRRRGGGDARRSRNVSRVQ
jgi:glycosyltransferase involved in cell wall biosynthesis